MLILAALLLAAPQPAPAAAMPQAAPAAAKPLAAPVAAMPQAAPVAAMPQAAPVAAMPICRRASVTPANDDHAAPSVHPLDREPAARQVLAVLRTQGGCITPVVVRDSVGLNPTSERP